MSLLKANDTKHNVKKTDIPTEQKVPQKHKKGIEEYQLIEIIN